MIFLSMTQNWADSLKETLGFVTKIFASANNTETREAMRLIPEQAFEMGVVLQPAQLRRLIALMTWAREDVAVMAVPTLSITMTGSRSSQATFFPCVPPAWLSVGAYVTSGTSLWRVTAIYSGGFDATAEYAGLPNDSGEANNLATEDGLLNFTTEDGQFNITVGQPRSQDLPSGAVINLAILGRLDASVQATMQTSALAEMSLTFTAEPDGAASYAEPDSYIFKGLPVLTMKPNWREAITLTLDSLRQTYATEAGPRAHFWQSAYSSRAWAALYSSKTKQEALDMIGFFVARRGRRGTFYFRSPTAEMEVVSAPANSRKVTVKGYDAVFDQYRDPTARHIFMQLENGRYIYREVNHADDVDTSGNTILTLYEALPSDMGAVLNGGGLYQARFADDKLAIEWVTDEIAEFSLTVRTVDYQTSDPSNIVIESGSKNIVTEDDDSNIVTEG